MFFGSLFPFKHCVLVNAIVIIDTRRNVVSTFQFLIYFLVISAVISVCYFYTTLSYTQTLIVIGSNRSCYQIRVERVGRVLGGTRPPHGRLRRQCPPRRAKTRYQYVARCYHAAISRREQTALFGSDYFIVVLEGRWSKVEIFLVILFVGIFMYVLLLQSLGSYSTFCSMLGPYLHTTTI